MNKIIIIFLLFFICSCVGIKKVDAELDGYFSWSAFIGGESVEIKGLSFEYESWSDEVILSEIEKYPLHGTIEVREELIYLKHPDLDKSRHVYRVGIENGIQYLIRSSNYDDFIENGVERGKPFNQVLEKRKCKFYWSDCKDPSEK